MECKGLGETDTEKVRTNMERVQEDWTKALVAESLTNRTYFHACILILILPLNKKTELISKCRHENKFYLSNFSATSALVQSSCTLSMLVLTFSVSVFT